MKYFVWHYWGKYEPPSRMEFDSKTEAERFINDQLVECKDSAFEVIEGREVVLHQEEVVKRYRLE